MGIMKATAAGVSEIKKFVPRLWAITRELFHEVTGFFFIAIAIYFTFGRSGLIQLLRNFDKNPDTLPQLLLAAVFVLMFAGFGVSSFLRARRVSRERQ
jgi:formate hydrogenlyase subunit 3/multisubunit Na+/H+ antiporter MnhD subunit